MGLTQAAEVTRWGPTKYATILFDPVVIGLAALMAQPAGWAKVRNCLLALGVATAVVDVGALFTCTPAGQAFARGAELARSRGRRLMFLVPRPGQPRGRAVRPRRSGPRRERPR